LNLNLNLKVQNLTITIQDDSGDEDAVRVLRSVRARLHRSHRRLKLALQGENLQAFSISSERTEKPTMSTNPLDVALDELVTEVSEEETIVDSAIAFIQGVPGLIQVAVDAALAAGATPAQLAKISELKTKLDAKGAALTAALQPPTA
jgi:hypothetical protein